MGKKALVLLALLPLLAMGGRQQGMGPGPGMPASSGGGSISPVGTPTCVYSMTSPISVPYTKHAAGDALVVSISENAAADYDTVTVTDGGSTYTEVVSTPVSTNYHVDLFGTLSLASSSGNLSVTVYQLTAAAVCVQEFSGVVEWGNTLATNTSSGSSSYSGSIMMDWHDNLDCYQRNSLWPDIRYTERGNDNWNRGHGRVKYDACRNSLCVS